jgi:ubiquinone/menaquinone biosynthesis C-methylase UbiE
MNIDITSSLRYAIGDTLIGNQQLVLDIGCGDGKITVYLAEHSKRVLGLDPNIKLIEKAQKSNIQNNLHYLVCQGQALCFGPISFEAILFCQSLHHIPIDYQSRAIDEAGSVLTVGGQLTIVEPVYQKGTLGKITALYSSERESKRLAIQAVRNLSGKAFSLISEKTIQVKCTCENFDDLYDSTISNHPNPNWNPAIEKSIKEILGKCEVTSTGEIVIDYYTTVFSFLKHNFL